MTEEGLERGPIAGVVVIAAATLVTAVLTLSWSALRADVVDAELWRSAVAGAAMATAFVAAGILAAWWRRQLIASLLWLSVGMAAIGAYSGADLAWAPLAMNGDAHDVASLLIAVIAMVATFLASTLEHIDLTPAWRRIAVGLAIASIVAASIWSLAPAALLAIAAWASAVTLALVQGIRRRDTLLGWFAVGALALLHHDLLAYQADPDAVAAIGSGTIQLLGLVAMLLGMYLHVEQGHSSLERRLHAAHANLDLLKKAREARLHEAEERLHQARSALAAIDLAVRAMPTAPGMIREALRSEVGTLRRLVSPAPASAEPFRVADALVGAISVERLYGVEVSVKVPPFLTAVGDAARTAEVAQCLLENARVHAGGAGVSVSARQIGDEVQISIADQGPGVPNAADVFESGVTSGKGQGLGLAIAARMMGAQGGRLWLDLGSMRRGATFVMSLPATTTPRPAGGGLELSPDSPMFEDAGRAKRR